MISITMYTYYIAIEIFIFDLKMNEFNIGYQFCFKFYKITSSWIFNLRCNANKIDIVTLRNT